MVYRLIGLEGKVFAIGSGDLGSIPGHVIPKTLKIVLDTSLLNTQQYKEHIKSKMEKGEAPSPTPRCSSYWKGSLLFTLDNDHQLYYQGRLSGLVGRVFADGPGNLGSIPGHVIPRALKMVLDNSLINTQQNKVRIKGKVEQSREWRSASV